MLVETTLKYLCENCRVREQALRHCDIVTEAVDEVLKILV